MRKCSFWRFGISVAFLLLVDCASFAVNANELEERLRTEAPQAWARLEARYATVCARLDKTSKIVVDTGAPELPTERSSYRVKRDPKSLFVEALKLSGFKNAGAEYFRQGEVVGIRGDFVFWLVRSSAEKPWRVDYCGAEADVLAELRTYVAHRVENGYLFAAYQVLGRNLNSFLLDNRAVELTSVAPADGEDEGCIKVTFGYTREKDPQPHPTLLGGSVLLDPSNDWCVRFYEASLDILGKPGSCSERVYYHGPDQFRFPVPSRIVTSGTGPGGLRRSEVALSDVVFDRPCAEEITLAEYGFPNLDPVAAPHDGRAPLRAESLDDTGVQIPAEEEAFVGFRVTNMGSRAVRIVGSDNRCGVEGCISLEGECPLEVKPGKNVEVRVRLTSIAGRFDRKLTLYTDSEIQPRLGLTASFEAIDAESND